MGPDVPGSGSVYTGSAGGTGQRTGIPRGRPPAGRTGGGDEPGVGSKLLATWRYTGFNADKACQSILKQTDSHHYSFRTTLVGKDLALTGLKAGRLRAFRPDAPCQSQSSRTRCSSRGRLAGCSRTRSKIPHGIRRRGQDQRTNWRRRRSGGTPSSVE